ncbi:MAG: hypothetical protein AB7P50_16215 [Alphaproteobacteria bacterium]
MNINIPPSRLGQKNKIEMKIEAFEDIPSFALKAGIESYFSHRHTAIQDDLRLKVTNPRQWDADLQALFDQEMAFKKEYQTARDAEGRHALIVAAAEAIGLRALSLDLVAKFCLSSVLASLRIAEEQDRKRIAEECRALAANFPKIIGELTRAEQLAFRKLTGTSILGRAFGFGET